MKVLPLKGYKALRALNAFHVLLLGVKMLPAYSGITYDKFFESFKEKSESEKEAILREGAAFVELSEEEVKALISFAQDPNGIAYTESNIKNLKAEELFEIIVAVCMEMGRIKVDLVSEEEKKKLSPSQ
jgi:hypothetical protein